MKKQNRFIKSIVSLVVSVSMFLGSIPMAFAQETKDEKVPKGYVTIDIEKFTLGQGYIKEPVKVPFYEGDSVAHLVTRLLGEGNYTNTGSVGDTSGNTATGFYLASVKDNFNGNEKTEIPEYILHEIKKTGQEVEYERTNPGFLGEFDYTNMSGWMYCVNSWFPNYGCSVYKPKDGDVIRWQFTTFGYGSDIGGGMIKPDGTDADNFQGAFIPIAKKDDLTKAVAEINSASNKEQLLANSEIKKAYDEAYKVLVDVDIDQTYVDEALEMLNDALESKSEKPKSDLVVPNPSVEQAINKTAGYLCKTVDKPGFGTIGGEWTVLSLARAGYKVPEKYYEDYYKRVCDEVKDKKGDLHKVKYTEYSRLIVALSSLGIDSKNVSGYDLTQPLSDFKGVLKQGINGPIWALIALDSNNYKMCKAIDGKKQATRENIIENILSLEITDKDGVKGGWALMGKVPDPDITGMALQALAKYKNKTITAEGTKDVSKGKFKPGEKIDIQPYIDRALDVLSKQQREDGGYYAWGATNSESTVQVLVALTELGIDPATDKRFIKGDGNWLVSALMDFYVEGGGFKHVKDQPVNMMATDQAMYGIVAYDRFKKGKNSLYDMTDAFNSTTPEVGLENINLNKTEMTMQEGNKESLTVKYNPENTTVNKAVEWSSSDEKVATVKNGEVTGVKEGTATITAKVKDKIATCKVTVSKKEIELNSISLNKTEMTIEEGNKESLTVKYNPENTTVNKAVEWSSSDEKVATVKNGEVTGVKEGTATITAKVKDKTVTCKVIVKKKTISLQKIELDKKALLIQKGNKQELKVRYTPENTTDNKIASWKSSDEKVAKIENGQITAVKEGKVTITATVGNKTASCIVVVALENANIYQTQEQIKQAKEEISKALQNTANKIKQAQVEKLQGDIYLYTVQIPNEKSEVKTTLPSRLALSGSKDQVLNKGEGKIESQNSYKTMQLILNKDEIKPEIYGVTGDVSVKIGQEIKLPDNVYAKDKLGVPVKVNVEGEDKLPITDGRATKSGNYKVSYSTKLGDLEDVKTINVRVTSNSSGGSSSGGSSSSKEQVKEQKLIGYTRYETAIKISKEGWNKSDNVVLVNSDKLPDALAATPFAKKVDAPILLTSANKLDKDTLAEIQRLQAKNVFVIGGEAVVSQDILGELSQLNLKVERISGEDRFKTSLAIANKLSNVSKVAVVNGETGLSDATSIAAIAANENMAILLMPTKGTNIYDKFIKDNNIDKSYVIGLEKAISKEVENKLVSAERIGGIDRNETNAKILDKFYKEKELKNIFVCKNGMTKQNQLIDALSVGILASKQNSPVVIVGNDLNNSQENALKLKSPKTITQVGGGCESAFNKIKALY
ncbi:DUF4430 domain-containing protein [Romboutsia maritimum]|uniref:DUF4430 domain-containing protein n=1 Tax=Romboutsia maritimum TaxID=2020948 RepID=A0A371IQN9_9FIRM|nr:cell wall-binding repeat-containing protein [Romboutsia maritimum]RDY22805.1 DUF4430 domain-containing protein [Romboutsia maritimum]